MGSADIPAGLAWLPALLLLLLLLVPLFPPWLPPPPPLLGADGGVEGGWANSTPVYMIPLISAAAAAKSHQSCLTLFDPIDGSPPGSRPWDSPGRNTGVGCQFLLQCMKVKRDSEVAQLCPTLNDPIDCSLPGSSVYGISQTRVLEWGAIAFSPLISTDRLILLLPLVLVRFTAESWQLLEACLLIRMLMGSYAIMARKFC